MFAVNPGGSEDKIKKKMNEAMENYDKKDFEGVTIAWNLAQNTLKCCGVTNSDDWRNSGKQIPDSCYKDATCDSDFKECNKAPSGDILLTDGCYTKIDTFVKSETNLVGGIGIGIALLQVLGVIIACKIPKDFQHA